MENNIHSDPKLNVFPFVSLDRVNLFNHLEELSDVSLDELLKQLHSEVIDTFPRAQQLTPSNKEHEDVGYQDDEIQILEVKLLPRKDRVTLKRGPLPSDLPRKSRVLNQAHVIENVMTTLSNENVQKRANLQEVMDKVDEKLASLRERERKLLESVRRNKKTVDYTVEEELAAMSGAQSALTFSPMKPSIPKQEKLKRDKPQDFSIGDFPLKKILKSSADTAEEKFRVLEARDKLFQSVRDTRGLDRKKGRKLVGTCPDMCPEKERLRRCYQAQVSPFEMIDYPKNMEMKEEWMVKEYARSSADQDTPLPHELRPVPVLEMTMLHLCRNIADKCEFDDQLLEEWYMFLWDRTRAIRKDLTQQDVCDPAAARLLEQCARFHIHCADRLAGQDMSVYDDKINTENLTKCLQTLKYLYNDLASIGLTCPNAPEFLCYSLLLNLNNPAIMTGIRDMSDDVLHSEPVKFALAIIAARETRNYHRFFKLVKETTYLNCCLLRRYFSEMRLDAISTVVRGFCPKGKATTMDVLTLANDLLFEGIEECIEHLQMCNLSIKDRHGYPVVLLNRRNFVPPEGLFPVPLSLRFIQGKREVLTSEVIWGSLLPAETWPHTLQSSFTPTGDLKPNTISDEMLDDVAIKNMDKPPDRLIGSFEEAEYVQVLGRGAELFEQPDDLFASAKALPFDFTQPAKPFSQATGQELGEGNQVVSSTGIFATSPTKPFWGFGGGAPIMPSQPPSQGFPFSSGLNVTTQPVAPAVTIAQPVHDLNKGDSGFFNAPAFSFTFKPPVDIAEMENQRLSNERKEMERKATEKDLLEKELAKMREEKARIAEVERQKMTIPHDKSKLAEEKKKYLAELAAKRREDVLAKRVEITIKDVILEDIRRKKKEKEKRRLDSIRVEEEKRKERERLRVLENEKKMERLKQQEMKLQTLEKKYRVWKLEMFASHWRHKAWTAAESRRLEGYREELRKNYPLICQPDLLDGNPFGLVIPSALHTKRRPLRGMRRLPYGNSDCRNMPSPTLPLVHIGGAVASSLEQRICTLYPDPNSSFRSVFPWKLLLCLPDSEETPVSLDTFIEMHFVDRFDWKFGVEKAPLTRCIHQVGPIELDISVRRVRGRQLLDGAERNLDAIIGANSILFFMTDYLRSLPIASERIDELRRVPGGSLIPIVVFVFGDRLSDAHIRKSLRLDESSSVIICSGSSQVSLVTTLSRSLSLAASISAGVPPVRSVTFDSFLRTGILDKPWRRVEMAITNYDILLNSPEPLIKYYNECIDSLSALFLDPKLDTAPRVAVEFHDVMSRIESPLVVRSVPKRDTVYGALLANSLDLLKLPAWPSGPVKSTQALNYRLHQYGATIVSGDKLSQKYLKWRIYRIIQRKLLWKGMDIYCDEDINLIMLRFPWIQVFQEFARVLIERFIPSVNKDLVVMFNKEEVSEFYYKPSLINDLIRSAADDSELTNDVDLVATLPHPEYDSILLCYAAAIERETASAEERERLRKFDMTVEEVVNAAMDVAVEPRDTRDLKRGFEELGSSLNDMELKLKKRRSDLEDLLSEYNSSREEGIKV